MSTIDIQKVPRGVIATQTGAAKAFTEAGQNFWSLEAVLDGRVCDVGQYLNKHARISLGRNAAS